VLSRCFKRSRKSKHSLFCVVRMKNIKVRNQTTPLNAALTAGYCESFMCRLKGLMFRKGIPDDWGLLLVQGSESVVNSAIHMFFVPFDLGIVWINNQHEIVDVAVAKRWIGLKSPRKPARYILEVTPARMSEFHNGDKLEFVNEKATRK